ncbi:SPFH domain-containing protein [Sulfurivirga sp.]|uniref:SPFH domain-containing protein n=1 Tax=Sulfurivirga sp. TaxID=2614236 RepID=UPI0025FE36EE|nr:SPFH domain-containing protein [Sulfurivirga sp.]
MDFSLFSIVLLGALVIIVFAGVKIVPQAEVWVIERLGRYHRTLHGGLNFIVPFIDRVRAQFNTQEQVIDIPPQDVITKDNVSVTINGLVFMRIIDAKKATYEILDLKLAIAQLAQTTLRAEIGKLELDETLSSREQLNAALLSALDAASENWGAKVTRVEISDIEVPNEIKHAMELQLKAERQRRATETEAEGLKNATIAEAEGQRQKAFKEAEAIERMADAKRYEQEQIAEGERKAMELIASAMRQDPRAAEFLLAQDRIQAFARLAESDSSNKIVVPYEATQLAGAMTLIETFLQQNGKAGSMPKEGA